MKSYAKEVEANTLSKDKPFYWYLDEDDNIHIRKLIGAKNPKYQLHEVMATELEKLQQYMLTHEWVRLSNSITKLLDGTEKEGLGTVLFDSAKRNNVHAQLVSQIAPIFVDAGIWTHNDRKREMQFHIQKDEWRKNLRSYYIKCLGIRDRLEKQNGNPDRK